MCDLSKEFPLITSNTAFVCFDVSAYLFVQGPDFGAMWLSAIVELISTLLIILANFILYKAVRSVAAPGIFICGYNPGSLGDFTPRSHWGTEVTVGGPGDEIPQKLKQFADIVDRF